MAMLHDKTIYGCGDRCPFCIVLNRHGCASEIYKDCGFVFDFPIEILTFQMTESLAKLGLYVAELNPKQTMMLIENGKEGEINIPIIREIARAMGVGWQYVSCENQK